MTRDESLYLENTLHSLSACIGIYGNIQNNASLGHLRLHNAEVYLESWEGFSKVQQKQKIHVCRNVL